MLCKVLSTISFGLTNLTSVGQAGFIITSKNGQTLGIDLYLSDCVEREEGNDGFHRLLPRLVDADKINLDVVIATHFHHDHFDVDAIPELMRNGRTTLLCPVDCADDVKRLGINEQSVTFVEPGRICKIGDFEIRIVQCDHGTGAPYAIGVLIKVDGKVFLEVGDTSMHLDWADEYLSAGPIDVLIAPINGAYGNMNEQDHVKLTEALKPKLTVPCHFGMFAAHGGNPGLWRELLIKQCPDQKYKIFTMGESITIK